MPQLNISLVDAMDDIPDDCHLLAPIFQNGRANHLEPFTIAIGRELKKYSPITLDPYRGTWLSAEALCRIPWDLAEGDLGEKTEKA